jgi:hypothetical protein
MPSTPGAAETESSLVAARHALETLAMSERNGCPLGAATAATGGRSDACSIALRPASVSNRRRRRFRMKPRSSPSSSAVRRHRQARGRWPSAGSNCCSSTARCSICSRRGPKPAASSKPLSPARAARWRRPALRA